MRDLIQIELNEIAGGIGEIKQVYPTPVPGYEIIGWEQEVIGWDTYKTVDYDFLTRIERIENIPIYDIRPIYAPITTVYTYY